jgi:hypothetical protein
MDGSGIGSGRVAACGACTPADAASAAAAVFAGPVSVAGDSGAAEMGPRLTSAGAGTPDAAPRSSPVTMQPTESTSVPSAATSTVASVFG